MKKIKILVSYDDNKIRDRILNTINKLNYVEIINVTNDKKETYDTIINSNPEFVFSKYTFDEETNLFDIIKKVKINSNNNLPIFNIISSDIKISDVKEITQEIGNNLNSVIQEEELLEFRLKTLLNEYRNFKKHDNICELNHL